MENEIDGQNELFDPYKRTRRGDPETSLEAARSVTDITGKQAAVLRLLQVTGPGTDQSIGSRYFYSPRDNFPYQSESGLRTRRSELVALGLVRWTGETQTLDSGRQARIWEAV